MPSPQSVSRPWSQQTAFITGAAGGLGQALARRLISRGVTVAVVDVAADRVAAVAASMGPLARGLVVDVTQPASVAAAVQGLIQERGGIDILVNAAGITGQTNLKSHEVDLADFDRADRRACQQARGYFPVDKTPRMPGLAFRRSSQL